MVAAFAGDLEGGCDCETDAFLYAVAQDHTGALRFCRRRGCGRMEGRCLCWPIDGAKNYQRSYGVEFLDSTVAIGRGKYVDCEKSVRKMDASYACSIGSSASNPSSLRFLMQDFNGGRTMSLNRNVP